MKKILVLVFLIFIMLGSISCQEIEWFPQDSSWIDVSSKIGFYQKFISFPQLMTVIFRDCYLEMSLNSIINKYDPYISLFSVKSDENYYSYFLAKSNKTYLFRYGIKTFVVKGKSIILTITADEIQEKNKSVATMEDGMKDRRSLLYGHPKFYSYLDSGVKKIIASSWLTEVINNKYIDYKPEYLIDRICYMGLENLNKIEFDNFMRCWAEGVPGYGIGESLDIEFSRKSNSLSILNGYIDFFRMNLYKENSRPKKIRIESDSPKFSLEYEFSDYVAFHDISLPAETDHVKLTILDVYKGSKYDDTCITAIMVGQTRTRSYEEEKKEVLKYLNDNGIIKQIDAFLKTYPEGSQ